jgi:hypothetical protein
VAWWLQFGQQFSYGGREGGDFYQKYGESYNSYPWECAEATLAESDGGREREREQERARDRQTEREQDGARERQTDRERKEECAREWERESEEAAEQERDRGREKDNEREREREREIERLVWQQKLAAEDAREWVRKLGMPEEEEDEVRELQGGNPVLLPSSLSPVSARTSCAAGALAAAGEVRGPGGGFMGNRGDFGSVDSLPHTLALAPPPRARAAVPVANGSAVAVDVASSAGLGPCWYGGGGARYPDAPSPLITFPNTTRSDSQCVRSVCGVPVLLNFLFCNLMTVVINCACSYVCMYMCVCRTPE